MKELLLFGIFAAVIHAGNQVQQAIDRQTMVHCVAAQIDADDCVKWSKQ